MNLSYSILFIIYYIFVISSIMPHIKGYDVYISNNDVIIYDSYTMKDIKSFVLELVKYKDSSLILRKDYRLLCSEIFVHNILCKLGICKNRTCHTNLSLNKDWSFIEKVVYKIISIFY